MARASKEAERLRRLCDRSMKSPGPGAPPGASPAAAGGLASFAAPFFTRSTARGVLAAAGAALRRRGEARWERGAARHGAERSHLLPPAALGPARPAPPPRLTPGSAAANRRPEGREERAAAGPGGGGVVGGSSPPPPSS